jgi:diaminopimelate decarboxylase
MKLSQPYSSNSTFEGELAIAGVTARNLANEFGTPLFVIDEDDFHQRAVAWRDALIRHFGNHAGTVYYAGKSFLNKEVARWINQVGIGLDVCSGGELAVARAVNFPAASIELHGNNKSESEIREAIEYGVGTIVMDSFFEIERVARIAAELGKIQKVYLRLTAGVEAHTHEFISTAHEDQKFGFSIASGSAWKAVEATSAHASLRLAGFHSHIGSQIFIAEGFEVAAARLIELLAKYRDHFDAQLPELDLGGGYGIAYLPGESGLNPDEVLASISAVVKRECEKHSLTIPTISIEPGRHIVGPTTTTIYAVGTTKSVELDGGESRRYIAVDGGMSDNIRPSLYGAEYTALLANRLSESAPVNSRIVGKHCESGDIVIRQIELPGDITPGDLLAVPATGAYGRSMASNYNHIPRPAVVAVKAGKARLITRRESINDLLALDI